MAVFDKHWSCNGSTSQLPYCIKKSISSRCYQHHAFRHRGPVVIRTFRSAAHATHARRSRGCFVTTIVESKTNDPNERSDGGILASIVESIHDFFHSRDTSSRFRSVRRFDRPWDLPHQSDPLPADVMKNDLGKKGRKPRKIDRILFLGAWFASLTRIN